MFLPKFKRWALRVFTTCYLLLGTTLIWGCSSTSIIPTTVPVLMDTLLEGDTPSVKLMGLDVTIQGVVNTRMRIAETLWVAVDKEHKVGQARSKTIADLLMTVGASTGLIGTGALPYAMKRVPKGYVEA